MRSRDEVIARPRTGHPLELPCMGGEYGIIRFRQRCPDGIRIKDHFPAGGGKCPHHMVTPGAQPVPYHHNIGAVNQGQDTVNMLCTDLLSFETFIDEFRDGFKYRGCNPDNICPGPECAHAAEIRCTLVGASANDKHLTPASLVCIMPLFPEIQEFPGACKHLGFKRDPNIGNR